MSLPSLWMPWTFMLMCAGARGSGFGFGFVGGALTAAPLGPVTPVLGGVAWSGTGTCVVVVASCATAIEGTATAAASVPPTTTQPMRRLPTMALILPSGEAM